MASSSSVRCSLLPASASRRKSLALPWSVGGARGCGPPSFLPWLCKVFRGCRPIQIHGGRGATGSGYATAVRVRALKGSPSSSFTPRSPPTLTDQISGVEIIVEACEREGVTDVFTYPEPKPGTTPQLGVCSPSYGLCEAFRRSTIIRSITLGPVISLVPAAEGYARASAGRPAVVCLPMCASTDGAINDLADEAKDGVPMLVIAGVTMDFFHHAKHVYTVEDALEIPRVVAAALILTSQAPQGVVVIHVPECVQSQVASPDWSTFKLAHVLREPPMSLLLPRFPELSKLEPVLQRWRRMMFPMLCVGSRCLDASEELRRFVELTGLPVATTVLGLGAYPSSGDLSLGILGPGGSELATYAAARCSSLLMLGTGPDEWAVGSMDALTHRIAIDYIDITPPAPVAQRNWPCLHEYVRADVKLALQLMNEMLEEEKEMVLAKGEKAVVIPSAFRRFGWIEELEAEKKNTERFDSWTGRGTITPRHVIQALNELTGGDAIIVAARGPIWMAAARFYSYKRPGQWVTPGYYNSSPLYMHAALGAAVANRDNAAPIILIGDFLRCPPNGDLLEMIGRMHLPVKFMVLEKPDVLLMEPDRVAGAFMPSAFVRDRVELKQAIHLMLDFAGPYHLNIVTGPWPSTC